MPVKFANSSDQNYDFACLRRRFRGTGSMRTWFVSFPVATSDSGDAGDIAGDDAEWEEINRLAMPAARVRLVADYLLESGQAAI